jgi:hypothetical protein
MSLSSQPSASALPEPVTSSVDRVLDPLAECDAVIDSIARKADKNKARARFTAAALTAVTAAIPVCLIAAEAFDSNSSEAFLLGRLLPGLLAASAAILSRWVQIEQPHQRWTLYRRWQRLFEAERLRYRQRIGRYSDDARDDTLIEVLAQGQLDLDDEWASLVPRSRLLAEDSQEAAQ